MQGVAGMGVLRIRDRERCAGIIDGPPERIGVVPGSFARAHLIPDGGGLLHAPGIHDAGEHAAEEVSRTLEGGRVGQAGMNLELDIVQGGIEGRSGVIHITLPFVDVVSRLGGFAIDQDGVGLQGKRKFDDTAGVGFRNIRRGHQVPQVEITGGNAGCIRRLIQIAFTVHSRIIQGIGQHVRRLDAAEVGETLLGVGSGLLGVRASRPGRDIHDELRIHRLGHRIIRGVVGHFCLALACRQGYHSEST